MLCTRCGQSVLPDSRFCYHCGMQLVTVEVDIQLPESVEPIYMEAPQFTPAPPPVPAKKGTLRAPIIVLAALCAVGFLLFALFPGVTPESAPAGPQINHSGHFTLMDGHLFFDASGYTGSEELNVPPFINFEVITRIGENCFYDCDDLTTVFLPDTLEGILSHSFYDCDSLRGIAVPERVTFIGDKAFADCDKLEAITLPASLEHLSTDAFKDSDALKYIFYSGTMEQWKALFDGRLNQNTTVYCSDGQLKG